MKEKIFSIFKLLKISKTFLYLIFTIILVQGLTINLTAGPVEEDPVANASQQQIVIGTVTDSQTGEAMPGVNIQVKGTTVGAITDPTGRYSISVADRNATLVFSFVGYIVQEIPLEGRTSLNVSLVTELRGLEEVVVVGYGTQKRVNLTGAVDVITGDELASRPAAQTSQLLQGQEPSMLITMGDRGSEPGAKQTLQIRGVGSLSGNTSPLVLVDGVEMDMNLIDPATIENVTILKDASASAVYGSRAAFGVVLITTKTGKTEPANESNLQQHHLSQGSYLCSSNGRFLYIMPLQ